MLRVSDWYAFGFEVLRLPWCIKPTYMPCMQGTERHHGYGEGYICSNIPLLRWDTAVAVAFENEV